MLPTKVFPDAPKRPPRRALHSPKIAPIRGVSVWLVELRMVEHVIDFAAELQPVVLSDIGVLQYADIGLELARAAANCAGCVADRAEYNAARHVRAKWIVDLVIGVRRINTPSTKRVRIETQVPGAARIELLERRNQVWLTRSFKVETGVEFVVV